MTKREYMELASTFHLLRTQLAAILAFSTLLLEDEENFYLPEDYIIWLRKWHLGFESWHREIVLSPRELIGDLSAEEFQTTKIRKMVAALDGYESAASDIKNIPTSIDITGRGKIMWQNIEFAMDGIGGFLIQANKFLSTTN